MKKPLVVEKRGCGEKEYPTKLHRYLNKYQINTQEQNVMIFQPVFAKLSKCIQ